MVIKSKAKNIFLDLLSEDEEDGEYTDIAIYKTKENIMITQEQKQSLVNSLISEWELMKASFTREDLTLEDDIAGIDVRIQVAEDKGLLDWSSFQLHIGDAQYDTNHQGYWGNSFLDYDGDEDELEADVTELVDDLISQVEEKHAENKEPFSLYDVVHHKNKLTEEQKAGFIELFSKGCRTKQREALLKAITSVETVDNFTDWGIYKRVVFSEQAPYCVYYSNQDYDSTTEIKGIREAFIKGY